MSLKAKYWLGWVIILVYYLLRHDYWNWGKVEPLLFGWMPVALWYHFFYAIISAGVVYIMIKFCWPETPEELLKREGEGN